MFSIILVNLKRLKNNNLIYQFHYIINLDNIDCEAQHNLAQHYTIITSRNECLIRTIKM